MFGTLLESTRSHESQARFTLLSVVAHVGIIVAAAAATASAGKPARAPVVPEVIDLVYPIRDRPHAAPRTAPRTTAQHGTTPRQEVLQGIRIPQVVVPSLRIPTHLPSVDSALDPAHGGDARSVVTTRSTSSITGSYLGGPIVGGAVLSANAVERVVAIRVRAEPVYPPALRHSGIEGAVRVRFVVDTLGRVEPSSVEVRASAHEAFSEAVRAALPRLRFDPARVAGRPVRQLVEMPFVFSLVR